MQSTSPPLLHSLCSHLIPRRHDKPDNKGFEAKEDDDNDDELEEEEGEIRLSLWPALLDPCSFWV